VIFSAIMFIIPPLTNLLLDELEQRDLAVPS